MSNSKYGGRGFQRVSEFLPALNAFTRSYDVAQGRSGGTEIQFLPFMPREHGPSHATRNPF